jgi:hypothetical protein
MDGGTTWMDRGTTWMDRGTTWMGNVFPKCFFKKMFFLEKCFSWKNVFLRKLFFLENCFSWKIVFLGKTTPPAPLLKKRGGDWMRELVIGPFDPCAR